MFQLFLINSNQKYNYLFTFDYPGDRLLLRSIKYA